MSFAQSSFLICPPVQSMHSIRNSSPGLTDTTIGMSGCQRLCGTSCFVMGFVRSTLNSVFGMSLSYLDVGLQSDRQASGRPTSASTFGAAALVR